MFNKIKIRTKILGGFSIITLIAAIVGWIGYNGMTDVMEAQDTMATVYLPYVSEIGKIRFFQAEIKAQELGLINRRYGIIQRRHFIDKSKKLLIDIEESQKKYGSMPKDKEDIKLWNSYLTHYHEWLLTHNTLTKLSEERTALMEQGLSSDDEKMIILDSKIYDYYNKEVRDAYKVSEKESIALNEMQLSDASRVDNIADNASSYTATLLLIFILVGVTFAFFIGIILTRNIQKKLGADPREVQEIANKVAKGILDIEFIVNEKDKSSLLFSVKNMVETIKSMAADAGMLSKAAVNGKLDSRADAKKYEGEYYNLIKGVNDTLDAVIGPLNVAAEYVDRISKGDIPPKITDNYNGDFNEIKNNLNQCIDAVNNLVFDSKILAKAAKEGKLDLRADASKHFGDFKEVIQGVNNTLDNVIGPLNVAAEYVDRISKGDIPPKITDNYNGDFNEIKNNLNTCITAVNALVSDAKMLAKAAEEGLLSTRADASKHGGEFRVIVQGVNDTLDNVIGPLNVAAIYVDRISKGDIPSKITDTYKGDFNTIKGNLNTCIEAVNALVTDAKMLAIAAVDGKLDTRADASKHQGDFRDVVAGVNTTLDNVIGPLNIAAEYVDRISKGDIPPKITEKYNGDFNEIKNNLNTCIDAINALVGDAKMLAKAAVEGKLDTRADQSKHQGDFREVVAGVNATLDNVIGPLNVAAEYVDRISKGDIPAKITDNYNGDFNEIKNNLNTCIEAVNQLVKDANELAENAIIGNLRFRGDVSKHGGDFGLIVKGVNGALDAVAKILDDLPLPVMGIDKDFKILFMNKVGCSIGNIKSTDLEGTKCYDYFKTSHCHTQNCACQIAMTQKTNATQETNAHPLPGLDLEIKYSGIPIIDKTGQVVGAYEAVVDQTAVKQAMEKAETMAKTQTEVLSNAGNTLAQLAIGNFTIQMEGNYTGDNLALKNNINQLTSSLSDVISQVTEAVQSSASAAIEISSTADTMAAASAEQSAQADEVASAVEEMSRTITQNAMSATQTAGTAQKNGEIAKEGGNVVKQTVLKMRDIASVVKNTAENIEKLGESSKEIGEIISVIDDIADQTNLLALNAAIEAARAGEQGRGFAVVADEVRKLAERTTEATKQIASMIKGIQNETEIAVKAMQKGSEEVNSGIALADRAGESLTEVVASSQEVLDMINQIAAASEEQSSTSEEIAKNVSSISQVTSESARRVQDIASSSDQLAKLTEHLTELMSQFTVSNEQSSNSSDNLRLTGKKKHYLAQNN